MLSLQGRGGGRGVMERSDEERRRAPNTVNLDNRGLHGFSYTFDAEDGSCKLFQYPDETFEPCENCFSGIHNCRVPLLEKEGDLRQLSLQHNSIRRLQHLDFHWLVMLDLYRNRIDFIHGLDRLVNLRVLIMAKNRIARIDGLDRCTKISVLDLHGNKIAQMSGIGHLSELRVLNLAGNQIRAISHLGNLAKLEDLNLRRNRLRSTEGVQEASKSLLKLNLSNNDIQSLSSLQPLSALRSLQTLSIENNAVAQNAHYKGEVERLVPNLRTLDSREIRGNIEIAEDKGEEVKMEETDKKENNDAKEPNKETKKELLSKDNSTKCMESNKGDTKESNLTKTINESNVSLESKERSVSSARSRWHFLKQETMMQRRQKNVVANNTEPKKEDNPNQESNAKKEESSNPSLILSNNSKTLWQDGLKTLTKVGWMNQRRPLAEAPRSTPASPTSIKKTFVTRSTKGSKTSTNKSSKQESQRLKIIYNRANIDYLDLSLSKNCLVCSEKDGDFFQIGYFTRKNVLQTSHFISTSASNNSNAMDQEWSSSSSSSDSESEPTKSNLLGVTNELSRSFSSSRLTRDAETAKFVEKGKDYLIEIENNTMSVFGSQATRFMERSISKLASRSINTVQFNYVKFDELVPLLSRFRANFPNCAHFEFLECELNFLGQLNALAALKRPITSLFIGQDGNALATKHWRHYAVFRLEHWGLKSINNEPFTENFIIEANQNYAKLAETALAMLPEPVLLAVVNRLELFETNIKSGELRSVLRDPLVRSVVGKEALTYRPVRLWDEQSRLQNLMGLLKRGHEVLHARGRVEQHWDAVLSSLVQRIVGQYSEMDRYKQQCLQRMQTKNQ